MILRCWKERQSSKEGYCVKTSVIIQCEEELSLLVSLLFYSYYSYFAILLCFGPYCYKIE